LQKLKTMERSFLQRERPKFLLRKLSNINALL
jgi:hypothetical protein